MSHHLGADRYVRKAVDFIWSMKAVEHLGVSWLVLSRVLPPATDG